MLDVKSAVATFVWLSYDLDESMHRHRIVVRSDRLVGVLAPVGFLHQATQAMTKPRSYLKTVSDIGGVQR
jgi:hypothetical protein